MSAEGAKPATGVEGERGRGELELSLGEQGFAASPLLFPSGSAGQRGSGSRRLASVGEIAGAALAPWGFHPDPSCSPRGWGPCTDLAPALCTRPFLGAFLVSAL